MLAPPAGDTTIEHVEYERRRRHRSGNEEMDCRMASDVDHGEKYGRHAAGRVAQREEVGQVEAANHRKMPESIGAAHRLLFSGDNGKRGLLIALESG